MSSSKKVKNWINTVGIFLKWKCNELLRNKQVFNYAWNVCMWCSFHSVSRTAEIISIWISIPLASNYQIPTKLNSSYEILMTPDCLHIICIFCFSLFLHPSDTICPRTSLFNVKRIEIRNMWVNFQLYAIVLRNVRKKVCKGNMIPSLFFISKPHLPIFLSNEL